MGPFILHIDDCPDLPVGVAEALQADGYQLQHTADPEEAMRLVEDRSPVLVMMEIELEGCEGMDLMAGIRDPQFGSVPVLVVTHAPRDSAIHGEAIALGVADFLTKPVRREDLLAAIHEIAPPPERAAQPAPAAADLSGELTDTPMPELLARLRRRGANGVLAAGNAGIRVGVQLRNGSPVGVSSSRRETVPEAALYETFRWEAGRFAFREGIRLDSDAMLELAGDPAGLLLAGVLDASPSRQVRDRLAKRESLYVSFTGESESALESEGVGFTGRQRKLLERLGGADTLSVLLDSQAFDEKLVYALWVGGWLELQTAPTLTLTELLGEMTEPELEEPAALDEHTRELEVLARKRAERERELEALTHTRAERERELEELTQAREDRARELEDLAPALDERAQELAQLGRARAERARELDALAQTRAEREQELEELVQAREDRARELEELAPELSQRAEELEELGRKRERRAKELKALARKREKRAKELEELAQTRKEHEQELEELVRARADRARELEELAPALDERAQELEELGRARAERARELEELAQTREEREQELEELARAREERAQELEELGRAREEREQELEELARAREERAQELEELGRARTERARELEELTRAREQRTQELEELEARAVEPEPESEPEPELEPERKLAPEPEPELDAPDLDLEPELDLSANESSLSDTTPSQRAPKLAVQEPEPAPETTAPPRAESVPAPARTEPAAAQPAVHGELAVLGAMAPASKSAEPSGSLRELAERVLAGDDFRALGIAPTATDQEVRAAYEGILAEIPDIAPTAANLNQTQRARRIRSRVEAAFANLQDEEKRRAYSLMREEEEQDRKAKPSAERALEGERWFRKGKAQLDGRRYVEAVEAFGMASHLDPEQGEYASHLGYALYLSNPNAEPVQREAMEHVARGIKRSPGHELSYVFLGRILKAKGDVDVARKIFQKALRIKPDFHPAVQELRVLEMRERKGKNKGVLSRLIGR